ncbi:MAG TPA: DNA double-strand break repair nuclease NurA [Anaerolineae bacterium]|nr:DNA double-strand break repair nuclease NurA [Anaerolineae bacterium]
MTLELSKVTSQVVQLGEQAAQRKHELEAITPQVREILRAHRDDAELIELAQRATETKRWRGAIPIGEPLDSAIDPPPHPAQLSIVAGDGSQIYPDAHGIALYYLINIGTIAFRHGTGQAPIVNTYPTVSHQTDSLEDDELISGPLVNAWRDVGELTRITELALAESVNLPTVALMDGLLALWVQTAAIPQVEQDRTQRDYLRQLDWLREAELPIGAFLSRPRSTNVVQLAYLTQFEDREQALSFVVNGRGAAFKGLRDMTVFASLLKPGQRSALFEVAPAWNTIYRDRGHSVHFFYINVGTPTQAIMARVEVPVWVAQDRSAVDVLHAAIVAQCKISIGYPYVLARAHEIAVVTNAERTEFERMIALQLTRLGVEAQPSEKAQQKSLLAGHR